MGRMQLVERRRPQSRVQKLYFGNVGIIVRAVTYLSLIIAAYYKMDARLQVIEFQLTSIERILDKNDDRSKIFQSQIDDLLKMQSAQQAAAASPRR